MNKNTLTWVLGAAVAVSVVFWVFQPTKVVTNNTETQFQPAGAVTNPDLLNAYFGVNGVRHWYFAQQGAAATTTICTYKTPNATTTPVIISASDWTGTSTLNLIQVSVNVASTTRFATTTTPVINYTVPANTYYNIVATSTNVTSDADKTSAIILAPLTNIVWNTGATSGNQQVQTFCRAELIELGGGRSN